MIATGSERALKILPTSSCTERRVAVRMSSLWGRGAGYGGMSREMAIAEVDDLEGRFGLVVGPTRGPWGNMGGTPSVAVTTDDGESIGYSGN